MGYLFSVRRPQGRRITRDELDRVLLADRDFTAAGGAPQDDTAHWSWCPSPDGPPDVLSLKDGVLVCFQPTAATLEKLRRIAARLDAGLYDARGQQLAGYSRWMLLFGGFASFFQRLSVGAFFSGSP